MDVETAKLLVETRNWVLRLQKDIGDLTDRVYKLELDLLRLQRVPANFEAIQEAKTEAEASNG